MASTWLLPSPTRSLRTRTLGLAPPPPPAPGALAPPPPAGAGGGGRSRQSCVSTSLGGGAFGLGKAWVPPAAGAVKSRTDSCHDLKMQIIEAGRFSPAADGT